MLNNMKKVRKLIYLSFICLFSLFLICCTSKPEDEKCNHSWEIETVITEATCTKEGLAVYVCPKCDQRKTEALEPLGHDYQFVEIEWTDTLAKAKYVCSRNKGHIDYRDCEVTSVVKSESPCGSIVTYTATYDGHTDSIEKAVSGRGHQYIYVIDQESINGSVGTKHKECEECGMKEESYKYVNIGYSRYGKLHVEGADLVDKDNNKVQLIGLSTHGLHWYGQYVNEKSLAACKDEFNINVFRFSLYTSEGGYCECGATEKEELYQRALTGVKIATKLDMYAIVDWHMLGGGKNSKNDRNPLYYKEQAKVFFDRITKDLADYDNVLYEIMNEPNGSTTWSDCKAYAEEIIPIIRANKPDAIVLCGNPNYSSDLESPRKKPLSFTNIMYTFHFYAGDEDMQTTSEVTKAYAAKLPIFITEHGGMDADGDGKIDYSSVARWYKALDDRNISYVAWNISHKNESSAILKSATANLDDFTDSNLKEWGIYYKKHIKQRLGLTE